MEARRWTNAEDTTELRTENIPLSGLQVDCDGCPTVTRGSHRVWRKSGRNTGTSQRVPSTKVVPRDMNVLSPFMVEWTFRFPEAADAA